MTELETGQIMDILEAAYPGFYARKTTQEKRTALALWAGMFAEDPPAVVAAAVKAVIASDVKGYPPSIGAVKEKIRLLTTPPAMSAAEAWAIVYRAIQRSGYDSREAFGKLPKHLQRLVGGPEQLRAWSMMDPETTQSVIASNFMRSYREREAQRREFEALPPDVRAVIEAAGGRLALEAWGGSSGEPGG